MTSTLTQNPPADDDGLVLAPPVDARPRVAGRVLWPDVARGLGIVLVVLGHAIGGLSGSGAIAPDSPWQAVFTLIYTFHMPLFFLLSGLFIAGRVAGRPAGFLRRAAVHVGLPYVVWGSIQFVIITQLGALVNAPHALSPTFFVTLLWSPPSQFWFLYVLFVLQVASWLALPRVGALVLLAIAVGLRAVADLAALPPALDDVCRYTVFFAAGVAAGPWLLRQAGSGVVAFGAALAWAGVGAVGLLAGWSAIGPWQLVAAPFGALAVIAVAATPPAAASATLVYLGRRSMPIYLLHVLFVAGTRIALQHAAGLTTAALVLPVAVLVGLAGPLLVYESAKRLRLARWLALG